MYFPKIMFNFSGSLRRPVVRSNAFSWRKRGLSLSGRLSNRTFSAEGAFKLPRSSEPTERLNAQRTHRFTTDVSSHVHHHPHAPIHRQSRILHCSDRLLTAPPIRWRMLIGTMHPAIPTRQVRRKMSSKPIGSAIARTPLYVLGRRYRALSHQRPNKHVASASKATSNHSTLVTDLWATTPPHLSCVLSPIRPVLPARSYLVTKLVSRNTVDQVASHALVADGPCARSCQRHTQDTTLPQHVFRSAIRYAHNLERGTIRIPTHHQRQEPTLPASVFPLA